MARRIASTLLGAVLVAALAGGCGGSSQHTQSSSATVAGSRPAGVPVGYAVYHGDGFSFDAPLGLAAQSYPVQGLPAGGSSFILSPAGVSPADADEQILEIVNPHLQESLSQLATSLRNADLSNHSVKDVQTSVHPAQVSGAQGAQVFNESYVAVNPPNVTPRQVLFKRTWLMVEPKAGTLIDLVVAVEPGLGGHLDANTVIDTFRLGS